MPCSSVGAGDRGVAGRGFKVSTNTSKGRSIQGRSFGLVPLGYGSSTEGFWIHQPETDGSASGSIKLLQKWILLQPGSAPASQMSSSCSTAFGIWDTTHTRAPCCRGTCLAEQALLGYYLSVNLSPCFAAPFHLRLRNSPSGFCLPLAAPFPRSG